MTKEFVPYELALEIKELGFEEPCFGAYVKNELFIPETERPSIQSHSLHQCLAPLYSQAFRFFREKHGLDCYIDKGGAKGIYHAFVSGSEHGWIYGNNHNNPSEFTYEEAELEYLKKLIELSKDI